MIYAEAVGVAELTGKLTGIGVPVLDAETVDEEELPPPPPPFFF